MRSSFKERKAGFETYNVPSTVVSKYTVALATTRALLTQKCKFNEVNKGATSSAGNGVSAQNPIEGPSFIDLQTRT